MARRLTALLKAARTLDVILSHVRNGGSLLELCDTWQVRYSDVIAWVRSDKLPGGRQELYDQACRDRSEWTDEMVLAEIRSICQFDIRRLYDKDGALLPIHELDAETAKMVQTAEVDEIKTSGGHKIGETSKVKVYDKLKALELAGRNRKLYTDNLNHSGELKLEDVLSKSYDPPPEQSSAPPPAA